MSKEREGEGTKDIEHLLREWRHSSTSNCSGVSRMRGMRYACRFEDCSSPGRIDSRVSFLKNKQQQSSNTSPGTEVRCKKSIPRSLYRTSSVVNRPMPCTNAPSTCPMSMAGFSDCPTSINTGGQVEVSFIERVTFREVSSLSSAGAVVKEGERK
jgi:hypothetical protein